VDPTAGLNVMKEISFAPGGNCTQIPQMFSKLHGYYTKNAIIDASQNA